MTLKTPLLLSTVALLALSACVVDPNAYPNDPNARTRTGAVAGGLLGAALGASSNEDRLAKAVVGGAIGAAIGGAIGQNLDRQAADLRGSIGNSNVTVTNNGQYLVVNMPQDLLFETDSAALRPALVSDIQAVAGSLLRYPNSRIEVIGHTDNTGAAAYNQDLSQRRAVSVLNVLLNSGVPGGRLAAYGRGEDQPIATNLTPQGRASNRRVEIIIRPTN
ncbi:MAG: OmpA family protein [Rhodobacteraceae bacterium]|nr:OmpA family protein [Paracoccaceae bacterium]MCF8514836.1 OmpA family protein [Paracoccaceae bacterium]MCF8519080.1 OmpA family protein [Paracoccaceae bacterium]